ncbi:MAG: hypothetical protein PSX36_07065 [bacterium]|nr:hypothetical protein [bacterium]
MKNLALFLALTLGSITYIGAQTSTPAAAKNQKKNLSPDEQAKRSADKAATKLGLTADQKAKWEVAEREHLTVNSPLRERLNGSTTPEERKQIHQEMTTNNDHFETTLGTFLTPDQLAKFKEIKKEKQQERKGQMH